MIEYTKSPFTYQEQLHLLESRGLLIPDHEEAEDFLKQVNYYRFTAYCIPFQKPRDEFLQGISFDTIVNLYRLDKDLRIAVFAALAPLEIFLKTRVAYELSHKYGAFAHYDVSIYQNETEGKVWLEELETDIKERSEPFLQHYREKYTGFPKLPIWIAIEIMSLGSLSKLYRNLTLENRNLISSITGIDHNVLKTWLHTLTFVRNICAHHGRLWSRNFSIQPLIPNKIPAWADIVLNDKKMFTFVAILEWIYRKAQLPLSEIEPVFDVMNRISTLDERFARWMGIPDGMYAGLCWKN